MSDSRGQRIVCVGEALIDLIGTPTHDWGEIERFEPRIGGAPANMAVAIKRLGGDSAFLGCRAPDEAGDWIQRCLTSEGVDVSSLHLANGSQTRIAIVTGPVEHRDFRFYGSPTADAQLTPEQVDRANVGDAAAILISSLLLTEEPSRSAMYRVLETCTTNDVPIIFDPNPRATIWPDPAAALRAMRPFIESATILKLGAGELDLLGTTVDELRSLMPPAAALVITDGRKGCRYWYGEVQSNSVSPPCVAAVDSTGAGDAFTAALALEFVRAGRQLTSDAVRFACAVGALTTTNVGAMDALPDRAATESLICEQSV